MQLPCQLYFPYLPYWLSFYLLVSTQPQPPLRVGIGVAQIGATENREVAAAAETVATAAVGVAAVAAEMITTSNATKGQTSL